MQSVMNNKVRDFMMTTPLGMRVSRLSLPVGLCDCSHVLQQEASLMRIDQGTVLGIAEHS